MSQKYYTSLCHNSHNEQFLSVLSFPNRQKENAMFTLDNLFLLLTGLLAAYLCWYFWKRYTLHKALHNLYYLMGFAVLLISGLLLIFLGLGLLASPYVLTVASLIPLGISMGIAEEYYPSWKKAFKWFALLGFLAIAVTSIGGMDTLKKIVVPLFHGVAGVG